MFDTISFIVIQVVLIINLIFCIVRFIKLGSFSDERKDKRKD